MNTPNLIIPGFAKSGTSTLHDLLVKHPLVLEGNGKEPHIYSIDKKYNKRFSEHYKHSFSNFYKSQTSDYRYLIDSSTSYSVYEPALRRIYKDTPDVKLIVIARDPFKRIRSHYRWMVSLGFVNQPFEKEIKDSLQTKFSPKLQYWGNFKNYIYFSLYGYHMSNILKIYPQNQVLLIKYEEFISNTQNVVNDIFNFLELPSLEISLPESNRTKNRVRPKPRNVTSIIKYHFGRNFKKYFLNEEQVAWIKDPLKEIPEVTNKELDFLFQYLKDDIKVFTELGFDLSHWPLTKRLFEEL